MQQQQQRSGEGKGNRCLVQGVSVGTVATYLGKKADAMQSHRWTVHVRASPMNQRLDWLLFKVVFHLHESFASARRELFAPPYEVTETGWGEFDIKVELHLRPELCPTGEEQQPLVITHALRLYPDDESAPQTVKKPVVSETYEEVVIQGAPAVAWALQEEAAARGGLKDEEQYRNAQYFRDFEPQHEMHAISVGRHKVAQHTRILAAKLEDLEAKVKAAGGGSVQAQHDAAQQVR